MDKDLMIEKTKLFVKDKLEYEGSGHDWFHIERVYNLSIYTTKVINKYIKSIISYEDNIIEFNENSVIYNNQLLTLKYMNIKEENYSLNLKYRIS